MTLNCLCARCVSRPPSTTRVGARSTAAQRQCPTVCSRSKRRLRTLMLPRCLQTECFCLQAQECKVTVASVVAGELTELTAQFVQARGGWG